MECEKNMCPVIKLDGVLATGKQFDLDITLPEDNRSVIYGVVSDSCHNPVCDAVVKLVEVVNDCGKEERKPVSHTFTDKNGEFVFGPLCPDKFYEIQIWVDEVKHAKICATCEHKGSCLKGVDIDCDRPHKPCECEHCMKHCEEKKEDECKPCMKHCEEKKECECKPCEKHCEEKKECECRPCEKHCEEKKECECKPSEKHCEEKKECECKPCEKDECRPCFGRFNYRR